MIAVQKINVKLLSAPFKETVSEAKTAGQLELGDPYRVTLLQP